MRVPLFLTIFLLGLCAPLGAQSAPTLDEILSQVRRNVRESWESLPDFVCKEKIMSQAFENGKVTKKKVIESIFTGVRKERDATFSMSESRDVTAIDGKAVRNRRELPDAPLLPDNSTANLLFAAFVIDAHEYTMAGMENVGGRPALRIDFATRDDQKSLIFAFEQNPFVGKDSGKAWIDPETMQVVRLELRILNMPGIDAFSTTADYEPLVLDGKQFWLPKTVQAESAGGKGKKSSYLANFIAEYNNCQKFDVTVGFKY